jgi:hypothetical protein
MIDEPQEILEQSPAATESVQPVEANPVQVSAYIPAPPGTPGEGGGEGLELVAAKAEDSHPDPLPDYQERDKTTDTVQSNRGQGWTLILLCLGLFVSSACVLLPQVDANRRMVYDREKLRLDLQQIQKQVAVNREFLNKVESDPQLSERLALRQMRVVRPGERVLDFKNEEPDAPGAPTAGSAESEAAQMSPFMIVNVPPPPPLPEYQPVGGFLGQIVLDPHFQLYLLGGALFCVAAGLVLGDPEPASA